MKKKLLSPEELKKFRLQQEEQKRLRAIELEEKKLQEEKDKKKLVSPKDLLDPKVVEEVVEEPQVVVEEPRDPIEVLYERLEEVASSIKEPKYYDEQIAQIEVVLASKLGYDEFNLRPLEEKIQDLRDSIPELPEIKYYDEEIESIKNALDAISIPEIPEVKYYDETIEDLTERVDQLQISGSEIFQQYGENIKELKKVTHQILKDIDTISSIKIPEEFDPKDIIEDIAATKETFYERVADIRKEVLDLPEVKYYDDELNELKEKVEEVQNSIPEVPEVRYYEDDLKNLSNLIEETKSSIPEIPEVKYYDDQISEILEKVQLVENKIPLVPEVRYYDADILNVKEEQIQLKDLIVEVAERVDSIKFPTPKSYDDEIEELRNELQNTLYEVESKIPELPELPEQKLYDDEIKELNNDIRDLNDSIFDIKKSLKDIESVEIPEQVDWTHEIDYIYSQIEKLKEQPVSIKEEPDPLLPLDQNFVTFDDLSKHYRLFINRVQQQLSSLGGGGEVNLRYLDDIDRTTIIDGRVLSYDSSTDKFVFISPGAAVSLWNETVEGNLYKNANIGINSSDPQVALDVVGDANVTGVITATAFYGDGSNLTGVASTDSWEEDGADIYRNSNVGINSEDPQVALDVVGDANVTGVITAAAFYGDGSNLTGVASTDSWESSGSDIYRNSNVGSNSEEPKAALDVVGNVSITGILTIGTETITIDPSANRFTIDGTGGKQIVVDGNDELVRVGSSITFDGGNNQVLIGPDSFDTTTGDATISGIVTSTRGFVGDLTGTADRALYTDVTGISTVSQNLTGNPSIQVTDIIAVGATFTGNVSIAGTLTYEDVTNVDVIGLITARSGIDIGFPGTATTLSSNGDATFSGVVTATAFTGEFVTNKDKTLEYYTSGIASGCLFRLTSSVGTKEFQYNNVGCLTTIVGTGVYVSKELFYDANGKLITIDVL